MLFVKEDEPGKTGKPSPGKIIAWFWMLAAIWVSVIYFGLVPWTPLVELTFWNWIFASFIFGTMSVGFYWGLAKGGFEVIVKALGERIKGGK
jgi:hypothetical protein